MASKRHIRKNSCAGKKQYDDQTGAVAALIAGKKAGLYNDVGAYKRRFGKHWHVGHKGMYR